MERQHHLEGMVGALTAAKSALQSCSSYPAPQEWQQCTALQRLVMLCCQCQMSASELKQAA